MTPANDHPHPGVAALRRLADRYVDLITEDDPEDEPEVRLNTHGGRRIQPHRTDRTHPDALFFLMRRR